MSDENIAFYTNIFDEIKNKVSLVSEIEKRGVPLFNSGQNRKKCRCPFHNDRTPSFFVYLEGDIESYYCFGGCGGGSVIDFVMNYDKLDLTQAIKYFSENYQILGVGDLNFDNIFKLNEPEKRINFSSLIYSKSFFTSSIIRNYLRETGLKKSDAMSNIKKYMQNIDESVFRKNLSAIDDYTRVIPRAIESVLEKEPFYELKKKCLFCTACNLTYRCHRPIFGIGNPDADTFIIKDRIEDTEDSQYKIIITKNISKFMKENNLDLHNTWITALLHCGSEDKNITINHYDTCILTHLKEHILLKKPKIIVLADHRAKKILMPYMKKIISEEKLMISLFGVQIGIRGMGHVA